MERYILYYTSVSWAHNLLGSGNKSDVVSFYWFNYYRGTRYTAQYMRITEYSNNRKVNKKKSFIITNLKT